MRIYDGHIHLSNTTPDPEGLLDRMAKAGIRVQQNGLFHEVLGYILKG